MLPVKMFLVDGDGVLRPTNGENSLEHYLGLNLVTHYVRMANCGKFPKIGVCTGREYGSAESILFDIGIPDSWSIIESGIFLFNRAKKKLLKNPRLTPKVEKIFRKITQRRIPLLLNQYPDDLFLYPGNQICVAIELQEKAKLTIEQTYEMVAEKIADLTTTGLVTIRRSNIAVDISPANIDKASGVMFLCDTENIEPGSIFGIGDSPGDFPMFNVVGRIGCPKNAEPKCKTEVNKRGGIISPKKYAMGVADIFYKATGVYAT